MVYFRVWHKQHEFYNSASLTENFLYWKDMPEYTAAAKTLENIAQDRNPNATENGDSGKASERTRTHDEGAGDWDDLFENEQYKSKL